MADALKEIATPEQRQFLLDVMVTAFEGGSSYWATARNVERDAELNYLRYDVRDKEDDKAKWHAITPEKIHNAALAILHGKIKVRQDIRQQFAGYPFACDACDVDAEGADVAVQVAAFNEIVYG